MKYHGQVIDHTPLCACCVNDAARAKRDPTNSLASRRRFKAELRLRWQSVRILVRKMIVDQDILSRGAVGLTTIGNPTIQQGQSKVLMFQRWFDHILDVTVLQRDGAFMRPIIKSVYDSGASYARGVIRQPAVNRHERDRQDTLFALTVAELQGIEEATSQQAVRMVTNGLLHGLKNKQIVRDIWTVIDKVAINRSNLLVETMVNKTFNEGVLDVYEAANVKQVGLVPESKVSARVTDAKRGRGSGPGSRASRKQTPSRSTIGRIRRTQRELERLQRVNVRTAGDDDVCPICEDISEGGPYTINRARSLIPAHPNCRCTFVPANDRRFSSTDLKPRSLQ
jgi:hypothetical protein